MAELSVVRRKEGSVEVEGNFPGLGGVGEGMPWAGG